MGSGFITELKPDYAKIDHPNGPTFTVTAYLSPNDGCPVIEVNTTDETGEIRVYVNDGQVFAGDPDEGEHQRYALKRDGVHRQFISIWDHHENTWHQDDSYDNAVYHAGVPAWTKLQDAQDVLDRLNGETP